MIQVWLQILSDWATFCRRNFIEWFLSPPVPRTFSRSKCVISTFWLLLSARFTVTEKRKSHEKGWILDNIRSIMISVRFGRIRLRNRSPLACSRTVKWFLRNLCKRKNLKNRASYIRCAESNARERSRKHIDTKYRKRSFFRNCKVSWYFHAFPPNDVRSKRLSVKQIRFKNLRSEWSNDWTGVN